MPTETGENPAAAAMSGSSDDAPSLPCPRCESTNTKFCYYNNYNLSQPRYFCKSCRRYWTQGGSLRNVPVGGGTRKSSSAVSSKRLRAAAAAAVTTTNNNYSNNNNMNMDSSASTTTATSSSSNSTTSMSSLTHEQHHNYSDPPLHLGPDPVLPIFTSAMEEKYDEFNNLKENREPVVSENEIAHGSTSFISLLNNQGGGLVGYGAGHGYGFYDMGLGLAGNAAPRGIWAYYSASTTAAATTTITTDYLGGCGGGDGVGGGNGTGTWAQVGEVENGNGGGSYVDPEGFGWPTFVLPTTARGLMK